MLFFKNSKTKVFCIGANKTGTTSLDKALKDLGYKVAPQGPAELLIDDWAKRDYKKIIDFCKKYDAFQDVPFSLPHILPVFYEHFPNSKYILTIRDSPDDWYNSLVRFHSKLFGKNDNKPTKEDLKEALYVNKGWMWKAFNLLYKVPEDDLYNKEILINFYNQHNASVIDFFRFIPEKLLILNLSNRNSYNIFCDFLNVKPIYKEFPWQNKTSPK